MSLFFFPLRPLTPVRRLWLCVVNSLVTLYAVGSVVAFFHHPTAHRILKHSSLLVMAGGLCGIWCYTFKTRLLNRPFWRVFFVVDVLASVVNLLLIPLPDYSAYNPVLVWGPWVLFNFAYYGELWLYAFRSKDIWCSKKA